MTKEKYIKLSEIKNWHLMELEQLNSYLIANNAVGIVNNYGAGIRYDMQELAMVFKPIKVFYNGFINSPINQ